MTSDTINDAVTIGSEAAGTLLAGRYRVIRQLGQGGMGSVWLAEDTQLDNKQFAIKMLPSILMSNKRAYKQIKSEALVSLKLTHPNIATLRSFEENNGNPFLVMDYIDGRSLDDYLAERGTLTEQETVSLLSPIASALDYAHAKNIIHRDIKPGNVMIAGDGTPYVLDFGIAREMQEATTRVTGKLSSGTLMYMSPEQLHGAVPTAAQDVYSFATMVYECLAGTPPFVRGQIEHQIEHDAPAPLPEGLSIAKTVMSGLAKKPEDRPETCSLVLGLSGAKVASCAIPPRPFAEMAASSRVTSGRQDVAERLLQSAQAVLEVDRMLAEVAKFESSCRDPQIHSARMAIKSARGEMESASGTRCTELLEAAKVIFAEAKSAYDDNAARRDFIDEISEFMSRARSYRELRYESGVNDCLHEVEQLKMEAEKASAGAWHELQEKFLRAREKAEAEIRSALERNREAAEKRRLEEAARRQQEELKKRQELEDQKRKEQTEIESCKAKVEAVKQEIRDECKKVVAYAKARPDYGDCLPVAQEICASADEEDPADLAGIRERLKKLERNLARIRSLISSHDIVVCATLNDVEVGRASMLYGGRRIGLPVRIKRRHRLTQNEGYLLEYARGNRKYCGWFSPACAKSSEGQCAMVPLHGEPSISEISRACRKKNPVRFMWEVLVVLAVSIEVSVLAGLFAYGCFKGNVWAAVVSGIVSFVLGFCPLYCRSMRREMRWAICDNGQYRMHLQSAFSESVLLLDRKERSLSEMLKEFKLHNWMKCFWRLLVSAYFALHIGLLALLGSIVGCWCVGVDDRTCTWVFRCAFLVALFFSCKRALRQEGRGVLIGLDDYRAKRAESPTIEEATEASVAANRVQARNSSRYFVLWVVAVCTFVVGGLCCWLYCENARAEEEQRVRQAERREAALKAKAEKARRDADIKRREEERARQQAEEKRREKELAENRRREFAQLESAKKTIADKVGLAERKVREAEKYRDDPVGFESHLASLDAAAVKLKNIPMPRTVAEVKDVLESVNAADNAISLELNWLLENLPRRDAAMQIEKEMQSELDAELVQFEVSTIVANRYYPGQSLRRCGNDALREGDFSRARDNLAKAKTKLAEALDEAKAIRKRRLAGQARDPVSDKIRELREGVARSRVSAGSVGDKSARAAVPPAEGRQVPLSGRSSEHFEYADTLSLLKFSSPIARSCYEKACKLAEKGPSNRPKVKKEYDKGVEHGGPKWPELEAWLDWWR